VKQGAELVKVPETSQTLEQESIFINLPFGRKLFGQSQLVKFWTKRHQYIYTRDINLFDGKPINGDTLVQFNFDFLKRPISGRN
jgi:hypothetical protein